MKKTVVFDFDGVIHSYTSGWQGAAVIPDKPVKGIGDALREIHNAGYEIAVVSTRCATEKGIEAVREWLYRNDLLLWVDKICMEKPPAIVYVDDRAICFDGNAGDLLNKINSFEPWNRKEKIELVNHPAHYNAPGRKECIEEMLDKWGWMAVSLWCEMTAYRYEYRAGMKEGNPAEQDLAKRKWYLEKAEELRKNASATEKETVGAVTPASAERMACGLNDAMTAVFEKGVEQQLRVGV